MIARRVAAALLFLSLAWTTAPALLRFTREAAALRMMPLETRREMVMGDFYRNTRRIVASVKPGEPLALVPRAYGRGERDLATFFNYYAYPHPTRTFLGREEYALSSADPKRPKTIVGFSGTPHLTTYEALRARDLAGAPAIVRDKPLPADARREMIVPFVASIDGPPPDTYTVEAIFASDAAAHVDMTFFPSGVTKRIELRGTQSFVDLVYETASTMGLGWMRIRSDVPLRAAFWFVNRGTDASTPLPIIDALPSMPLRFPAIPGARLWLVNPHGEEVTAMAGGVQARIPPYGIVPMGPEVVVTADRPIFAFLSEKQPRGGTRFTWPESSP
jgi:hypothetical protein